VSRGSRGSRVKKCDPLSSLVCLVYVRLSVCLCVCLCVSVCVCVCVACDEDEFACESSGDCIASSWVCDSQKDCPDFSDELNCSQCYSTFISPHIVSFYAAAQSQKIAKNHFTSGVPKKLLRKFVSMWLTHFFTF